MPEQGDVVTNPRHSADRGNRDKSSRDFHGLNGIVQLAQFGRTKSTHRPVGILNDRVHFIDTALPGG
jgi:hypothetical protein